MISLCAALVGIAKTGVLGITILVVPLMANAAGPIMVVYPVAVKLQETGFVGTGAWFFFVINRIKVPFSANLGLMTVESAKLSLMILPFILAGAAAGILLLKRIPQRVFTAVVQVLAVAAAIKFFF